MSGNVKTRIRTITAQPSLFPTSQSRTTIGDLCRLLSPRGSDTGFPRSVCEVRGVRCLLLTGRDVDHESAENSHSSPLHYRFGQA
ncbi:hypothetical protein GEA64_22760 [Photorhabdus khanii]|uniref:Uncharacterized protein n=1 Tax=Photorhabdus khanii TaxID=1004150 RepID=A0A7C9GLZ5_9GAMM|nr:hypothetical protein [Photorhabdus khanii]MQL50598.1 hypothetical protein [Photorhabdus khanii]